MLLSKGGAGRLGSQNYGGPNEVEIRNIQRPATLRFPHGPPSTGGRQSEKVLRYSECFLVL